MDDYILRPRDSKLPHIDDMVKMTNINVPVYKEPAYVKEVVNSYAIREKREIENANNLKITAENSFEIIDRQQVQINQKNEDLQNQRELIHMLKQQLNGISRTLSDLFIIEEKNQEILEEANVLARDIYSTMIQNKKIDWKSLLIDKGPDVLLTAIPIILQLAKVI